MPQLNDDISVDFIGARNQDNEELAFQSELADARAKDSENEMVSFAQKTQQEATQQSQGALNAKDGQTPTEQPKGPQMDTQGDKIETQQDTQVKDKEDVSKETQKDEWGVLTDAPLIIGKIAANLPKNITVGTLKAAKEAVDAVIPNVLERGDAALVDMGFGEYVEAVNGFVKDIENGGGTGDKFVQEMAQFAVPFSLYMKGLGAVSTMGNITKAVTADSLASFFNLDPHMARLSTALQEIGVHNEFVAYLADQEGGDTENRFRNMLENQAVGGAMGLSIYSMVKAFKGVLWAGKNLKGAIDKQGLRNFILGDSAQAQRGSFSWKDIDDDTAAFLNGSDFFDEERTLGGAVNWKDRTVFKRKPPVKQVKGVKNKIELATNKKQKGEIEIFHGTDEVFEEFDVSKTADGSVWFTDKKTAIGDPNAGLGATGTKRIMKRIIPEDMKLATREMSDKFFDEELISQGFNGVKFEMDEVAGTYYQIFNPEKLKLAALAGLTGVAATPDKAEAGIFDVIKKRNKQLKESLGEENAPKPEKMPDDPRSEVEILNELPDDVYIEWDQETPIKQWLWIKYPELLKGEK